MARHRPAKACCPYRSLVGILLACILVAFLVGAPTFAPDNVVQGSQTTQGVEATDLPGFAEPPPATAAPIPSPEPATKVKGRSPVRLSLVRLPTSELHIRLNAMNIGLNADVTLRPALFFSEECLDATSLEVALGDMALCQGPPLPPCEQEQDGIVKVAARSSSQESMFCSSYLKYENVNQRIKSLQRCRKQKRKQAELQKFLTHQQFRSMNYTVPLASGELIHPIHLAASCGRPTLLRLILNQGVDPNQESSHGRTALDMAKGIKGDGMSEVIGLLTNPVQTRSVRSFLEFVRSETLRSTTSSDAGSESVDASTQVSSSCRTSGLSMSSKVSGPDRIEL